MGLKIEVFRKEEDDVLVFGLKGSLDTDTFDEFKQKAIQYIVAPKPVKAMIVDMEYLDYISSMGVSVLLEVRKMVEERGGNLIMVHIPKHIAAVFDVIKALPNVKVFKDMEEADAYFMELQKRVKEQQ